MVYDMDTIDDGERPLSIVFYFVISNYCCTFAAVKLKKIKIMKEKTVKQLVTTHNRLARLINVIDGIKDDDFDEYEQKKLSKLQDMSNKLILEFANFKIKAMKKRGIEVPDVW